MIKRSEFSCLTWKGVLINPICRLILPFLLLRYKGFWGLRNAAIRYEGIVKKCYALYCASHNAFIPLNVKFDGPPCLPHGINGIFIAWPCHLGKNVVVFQQVTIGENTLASESGKRPAAPKMIGDGCYIGAGAKIIGDITIGENCRIGANCCVYTDMSANSVAVMAPTRIIQKENLDNHMRLSGFEFDDGICPPAIYTDI